MYKVLVSKLLVVTVCMFAFGYALVPLYDLFCEVTGIGGKTGQVEQSVAIQQQVVTDRLITVEFTSVSTSGIPWEFAPRVSKLKVHPGEINEIIYSATNKSSQTVVGQAIPSVTPGLASKYFNKTECFCFTQQTLEGKEQKDMPVRFIIDPDLPDDVHTITLSYSFFNAEKYAQN
jgi:cytochrome c oxidase assembly protein subunit 11